MVLLKVRANGTTEYVNCGHVPPVLVNSAGVRRLEESNIVVGLVAAAQYTSGACELLPGDRLLIFTDGITEAENSKGEQFGDLALESRSHLHSLESVFEHEYQHPWEAVGPTSKLKTQHMYAFGGHLARFQGEAPISIGLKNKRGNAAMCHNNATNCKEL